MSTYPPKQLKEILDKHREWLSDNTKGERADLSEANLRGADLYRANLYGANLNGANLNGANLNGADLSRADLHGANLNGADLSRADLSRADLHGANLNGADLNGADLSRADLSRADLHGANLYGADLNEANLSRAKINKKTKLPDFQLVPEEGSFIGWKKVFSNYKKVPTLLILKLEILKKAKRTSSLVGRKCRASSVKVIAVYNSKGKDITKKIIKDKIILSSSYVHSFKYSLGKTISVKDFDDDLRVECTKGIHFFITRKEAEEY